MRRRGWLAMAAGAALVPLAGLALAAALLNADVFKPTLVRAVERATGRAFRLNGPLRVTWSLWPTIQVNDVALANAPGGTRPDMAHAERIEAQISLPALLAHRLDVLRLTLIGPNILFERIGDRPNWVFGVQSGNGAPLSLRVHQVHVQNGLVTLRLPAQTRVVGLRSVDVRYPAGGRALSLNGIFVYSDNQPFALRATASAIAGLFDPWRTEIGFSAFDTEAQARGTMALRGAYDLEVTGRSGTLEALNALLPAMQLSPLHGLSLSAHLVSRPTLGAPPMVGPAHIAFDEVALGAYAAGLSLGRTEIALSVPGGPAMLRTQGRFGPHAFSATGSVQVPQDFAGVGPVAVDLAASSGGVSATVKGAVRLDAERFAGLDAAVGLRAPSLAQAASLASLSLPPLQDLRLAGQVTVPGDLGSLHVARAVLASEAGTVEGDLVFRRDGAEPALRARLHADTLDADRLVAVFGGGAAGGPGDALPWVAAGGAALDLVLNAERVAYRGEAWRSVGLTLQRTQGRQLGTVRVAFPAGPLALSFSTDSAAPVRATLSLHAPGVPLGLLARVAGLPGTAQGDAKLDAQLHGSGRNWHELAGTLDGTTLVTAVDGRMSNALFRALASGALSALGITVPPQGETALRCLGVAGTVTDGVLRLRTIALETSYLSLEGAGEVDLGRQTLRLKLRPLVAVAGSKVAAPVVVDGPWQHVSGRLDASGLDKVGLLIDGIFGGDTATACKDAGLAPG